MFIGHIISKTIRGIANYLFHFQTNSIYSKNLSKSQTFLLKTQNFRFLWYVNGRLMREGVDNVEFYYPKLTRCVAVFKLPTTGHYTVVAQNEFGNSKSSGYVEIASEGKKHFLFIIYTLIL